jgi:hypothetical protein
VPILAVTALLGFVIEEETSSNRDGAPMQRSQGFVRSRIDTFFRGNAVITISPRSETVSGNLPTPFEEERKF